MSHFLYYGTRYYLHPHSSEAPSPSMADDLQCANLSDDVDMTSFVKGSPSSVCKSKVNDSLDYIFYNVFNFYIYMCLQSR